MAMDSWSTNEYRTFVTSRRDDVFENREASAFSFMRASVAPSGDVLGCGDYGEKEVYFDTDVKTVQWESVVRMALRKSPEFEFEFKSAPVSPVLSQLDDDDVFSGSSQMMLPSGPQTYKQHPVYRNQVDDGSAKLRAPTFVVSQRTVPEPFSQMSPHSLSRMYQPKYSKFCVNSTDVAPVETAMDSRSSSFRSQTSMSGDRDTAGSTTTTSRDSNGSSNDASSVSTDTTFDRALEVFDHAITPTLKFTPRAIPSPPDRKSVVTGPTNADHLAPTNNVSWLRSPLKWKGIFKKSPKPPRVEPPTDIKSRPMSRLFHHANCDNKNLPGSKPKSFLALPVDQQRKPVESKLKPVAFPSDSSDIHSVVSTDRDRDQSGLLKIRERWLKYMRMLKPPYGKASSKPDNVTTTSAVERDGGSFPAAQALGSAQEYVHTRAKSMPAILKTPPLRPRSNPVFQPSVPARVSMMPPAGPSSARKNSFLAHSGSLASSSSPRLMKNSSPRLMSLSPKVMKSSPKVSVNTISPRMSSSSASSMSELHSAVQGAIAHCKQSHSGLLSPGASSDHHH